jgi:hypothetical protein
MCTTFGPGADYLDDSTGQRTGFKGEFALGLDSGSAMPSSYERRRASNTTLTAPWRVTAQNRHSPRRASGWYAPDRGLKILLSPTCRSSDIDDALSLPMSSSS